MRKILYYTACYANWIISQYKAIKKLNLDRPILRLISIEKDIKSGELKFRLQLSGKNIFPVVSSQYLKNIQISKNFNKIDQEIIFNFLTKDQKLNNKIIAKTYDREKKEFLYTVEFFDKDKNVKKCIIMDRLSLLSINFDKNDFPLIDSE
jgi:hypothetical protein